MRLRRGGACGGYYCCKVDASLIDREFDVDGIKIPFEKLYLFARQCVHNFRLNDATESEDRRAIKVYAIMRDEVKQGKELVDKQKNAQILHMILGDELPPSYHFSFLTLDANDLRRENYGIFENPPKQWTPRVQEPVAEDASEPVAETTPETTPEPSLEVHVSQSSRESDILLNEDSWDDVGGVLVQQGYSTIGKWLIRYPGAAVSMVKRKNKESRKNKS
jgi:hypothetical protein